MPEVGLIGYPLSHSRSPELWQELWEHEGITDWRYRLFPLPQISMLPELLLESPELVGLNVTIPYKQQVLPYLHQLSPEAEAVGAVNTIRIMWEDGTPVRLEGFNTDVYGFRESFRVRWQQEVQMQALVLGTGGAAQAVQYVLQELGLKVMLVSRKPGNQEMSYEALTPKIIQQHKVIVNASPVGTAGIEHQLPYLPYSAISKQHYLYDLVYNPEETPFLREGAARGATVQNGLPMLRLQAEKAWELWQG